jgi:cytochrome P450
VTTGVSDAAAAGVYYDPYDFDIDVDPYPLWQRMRDEVPLYYNDRYDFFALSRYDDVQPALVDWETTARGGARCSSSSGPTSSCRPG